MSPLIAMVNVKVNEEVRVRFQSSAFVMFAEFFIKLYFL